MSISKTCLGDRYFPILFYLEKYSFLVISIFRNKLTTDFQNYNLKPSIFLILIYYNDLKYLLNIVNRIRCIIALRYTV